MSRYSNPCPACGVSIRPSDIHLHGDSFPCPACGEWLTIESKYTYTIWGASLLGGIVLAWHWGYRDSMLIFVTVGITSVFCFLGIYLQGFLLVPAFKRVKGKPFEKATSLHLTDKPEDDKKPIPK
jgi:predicted RNA-binding Zn-ribbon protein involved in translation (DUF1610 family)